METPAINVINLVHRTEKRDHIISEFKKQNIKKYEFWSGVICEPTFTAISKSHKNIVRDAKNKKYPYVVIAEDDCVFSDTGSWEYYLANMPKEFDLYLSSIYYGQINQYNVVDDFCALTLYTIHSRYYDTFLNTNEIGHIDRSQVERRETIDKQPIIIPKGKFIVSPLFCTYQLEGFSDNVMGNVSYNEKYLSHRKFYSSTQPYFSWAEIYARSVAANNALIATSL